VKHETRLSRLERRRQAASIEDIRIRIVDYDGSVLASYQLPAHSGAIDYRKHLGLLDETRQLTFADD
jgi:hypothetical protein